MRYSPSEKLEIIRIVEDSELSVRQTLRGLGIHRSTFYNWYRRYQEDGFEGLGPKKPKARTFWNKIPDEVKEQVVQQALEQTELSPRELACRITDTQGYFISESSVYRILKSHDLITRITQECFHFMKITNPEALIPLLRVLSARIRDSFKLLNPQNPPTRTFRQFQDRQKPSTQLFTMSYISYKIYLDSGSSLFP